MNNTNHNDTKHGYGQGRAIDRRISVAPMLDWTDRHCRYFHRLISPHALLFTEMVTCGALLNGDTARHLRYNEAEHPVALQLGGSEPADMAACTKLAAQYGYDEVNINIGCPSERVQRGAFGACLMREAQLVADCIKAMKDTVPELPVTVKTRIGVDNNDSYEFLTDFIETTHAAGCDVYTLHARKAWLSGLSPKENRDIPPLSYETAHRIKRYFPQLHITLNGGIQTIEQIKENLSSVDGIMIGRAAYQNPWFLHAIEREIFGNDDERNPHDVLKQFIPYIENEMALGVPIHTLLKCTLGLFQGVKGARAFRRHLSENMHSGHAKPSLLLTAAAFVENPPRS